MPYSIRSYVYQASAKIGQCFYRPRLDELVMRNVFALVTRDVLDASRHQHAGQGGSGEDKPTALHVGRTTGDRAPFL